MDNRSENCCAEILACLSAEGISIATNKSGNQPQVGFGEAINWGGNAFIGSLIGFIIGGPSGAIVGSVIANSLAGFISENRGKWEEAVKAQIEETNSESGKALNERTSSALNEYATLQGKASLTTDEQIDAVLDKLIKSGIVDSYFSDSERESFKYQGMSDNDANNIIRSYLLDPNSAPAAFDAASYRQHLRDEVRAALITDPEFRQPLIDEAETKALELEAKAADADSNVTEMTRLFVAMTSQSGSHFYDAPSYLDHILDLKEQISSQRTEAQTAREAADEAWATADQLKTESSEAKDTSDNTIQNTINTFFDQAIADAVNRALGVTPPTDQEAFQAAAYDAAYLHAGPEGQKWIDKQREADNPLGKLQDDVNTVKSDLASFKGNLSANTSRINNLFSVVAALESRIEDAKRRGYNPSVTTED